MSSANSDFCLCPSVEMAFIILICVFIVHGVLSGPAEQRQLRSTEVSNITAGSLVHRSFNETRETNDSERNLPTDNDFNTLIVEHNTETTTGSLTAVETTTETFSAKSLTASKATTKPTHRRPKDHRALNKSTHRFLIRSGIERNASSKFGSKPTLSETNAADDTKGFSRIKSDSGTVNPRKISHNRRTRLRQKFQAEFRRILGAFDNLENVLISAYLKDDPRSDLDAIVAQHESAKSIRRKVPKQIVRKESIDRSTQMVVDYKAASEGEARDYQTSEPKLKSFLDVPSAFLAEYDETKTDETGSLDSFLDDNSKSIDVQSDKKSNRVKRDKTGKSNARAAGVKSVRGSDKGPVDYPGSPKGVVAIPTEPSNQDTELVTHGANTETGVSGNLKIPIS